jgi:NMD protein affecting ribosome stability and mRNA decay
MICKICGYNERDDTDGICDDCKMYIIDNNNIPQIF